MLGIRCYRVLVWVIINEANGIIDEFKRNNGLRCNREGRNRNDRGLFAGLRWNGALAGSAFIVHADSRERENDSGGLR
jgi:hypothetical protein